MFTLLALRSEGSFEGPCRSTTVTEAFLSSHFRFAIYVRNAIHVSEPHSVA
jgi:hypothetical protein